MTEFEAATIAYQQATIAYQQASLAYQESSLTAAYVQAGAAAVVGLLQAGIVAWGIRAMVTESAKRGQEHAERHEESMLALRALIERTAPQQT